MCTCFLYRLEPEKLLLNQVSFREYYNITITTTIMMMMIMIITIERIINVCFSAGWEVHMMKNCDRGLENAAFSRPRSQFFTIRTDP